MAIADLSIGELYIYIIINALFVACVLHGDGLCIQDRIVYTSI